jgi:hypothetical protein
MTNHLPRLIAPAALMVGLTTASLHAQTPAQSNIAGRGTELGGSIAAAVTSSETAPVVAGDAGWSMTRWITFQARGAWFARGDNTTGVGADVGALLNVVARRPVTPYVGVAFGLYRATIMAPAAGLSEFYRTRMADMGGAVTRSRTFTDPAWRFTAGVDVLRHRNISIRPEASVTLVHGRGATDTITMVGVRLGYVFEDHPVTPSVR